MNRTFHKQLFLLLHITLLCFNLMTFCSSDVDSKKKETPIAYFASKKDTSLIGSGEVKVDNDNELFFYGFSTNDENLTRYLRPKIPLTLITLHQKKCTQYIDDLATAMQKIMVNFYREHPALDPCNTETQHILLSLLHLLNTTKRFFTLECIDGQFKLIYRPIECKINPLQTYNCFFPIAKVGASKTGIQSEVHSLIKENPIVRKSMYQRPQELVNKITKTDSNEFLENIIHVSESEWLKRCNHPSTTKEYQSLRTKWAQLRNGTHLNTVVHGTSDREKSILSRWNHNRNDLLKFAAILRQNPKASPEELLFIDNLIELAIDIEIKPQKTEPSCITGLCSLLSDIDIW